MGTPRKGPSGSDPAASARARSNSGWMTAFSSGFNFSIRAMAPSTNSAGEASPFRTSSAWAVASIHAVSSLMPATVARRIGPRRADSGGEDGLLGQAAGAGPDGDGVTHVDVDPAGDTAAPVVELAPAVAVLEDHRTLALNGVLVAPLEQRHQHRPQVGALLGQPVLVAQGPLLI